MYYYFIIILQCIKIICTAPTNCNRLLFFERAIYISELMHVIYISTIRVARVFLPHEMKFVAAEVYRGSEIFRLKFHFERLKKKKKCLPRLRSR